MPLSAKETAGCTATFATVAVGNVSASYLAADTQRISIIFFPANAVRATFKFVSAAVLDEGLTCQAAGQPQLADISVFGPQIQSAIAAIASVLGPTNFSSVRLTRPA